MNTFTLKISSFLALVVLTIPTGAQAYRFVDSSTTKITDTAYLLTHTYTAGFLNEDSLTPIVAAEAPASEVGYPQVQFAIEGISDALLQTAEINSLVLSTATIQDNQYLTTAGNRNTFVLMTLVTLPSQVDNTTNVSLAMRSLPFTYTRDGEEKTGSYNLQAAETPDTPVTTISVEDILINVGK